MSRLSSVITAFNFFFWGSMKDNLYIPPFRASLAKLSGRMRTSSAFLPAMIKNMLKERAQFCDLG